MKKATEQTATAQSALLAQLGFIGGVLSANTKGITQEESLIQPRAEGNCLNWVLGHIVANRNALLALAGKPPVWDEEKGTRYERGSERISGPGAGVLEISDILADFERAQAALLEGIAELTAEDLSTPVPWGSEETDKTTALAGLVFHEAYHLGQTGLLRRLLGREGAIQ